MELEMLFAKGSGWRKWDLHIHSDCGLAEDIVNKIIETGISVFSITDHCNVDHIDKFLELTSQKQAKGKEIFFLPGVELRTDKGKKSVHLIGIFPFKDKDGNKIDSDYLKQNLLSKIDCSDADIINAGKEVLGEGRSAGEYRKRGCIEKVVNFEKAAEQIRMLGGITIVHAGIKSSGIETEMSHTKGENSASLMNSLGHTKRKLMKDYIDVCELSNWSESNLIERDFYLEEFKKPSVVFSDAHSLSDIDKKATWVKADPTFEGFKQIIYEPKIRISEKKELYLYPQIISVQLQGAEKYKTSKDKEDFPPINLQEQIWFNPNLTTIIGPRASGKTVLVELLSYPFDKHLIEVKREEKLPLIQFLSKRFPNLKITVSYRHGEQDPKLIERKIEDLSDPFYTSPLNIEYWRQGQIEEVADKKEMVIEYIKDRLKSSQILNFTQEIEKINAKLRNSRTKYLEKYEVEIEKKKLLAERKQIDEYFEKLKTQEYIDLTKGIRKNRAKNQILASFIESLESITESLEEFQKKSRSINVPERERVLELFAESSLLRQKISEFYKFLGESLTNAIKRLITLKELIGESNEKESLEKEESELKKQFLAYCEKYGIKITQIEYEKRTNRLNVINQKLREIEGRLNEYKEAKNNHNKLIQELKGKLGQWRKENDRIIKEFNESYSKSNVRAAWEDPATRLPEWVKEQFLASDSYVKTFIRKHYHILSPVREDFIGEIIKELILDKKYSLEKVIECLRNKKIPPLEKSGGKEENLGWFFQRDETEILREDLIMRLQEYEEKGNNLIQYKKKTLGKDTMSFGERCGTILELILHSGDHPLIIDQPEEHLDSKFIANRIVDIARKQKIDRQIIICTHNANIVVLGDSELVTVLNVGQEGTESCQGSIENPLIKKQIYDILEGGPEAFRKREQKYGFMQFL